VTNQLLACRCTPISSPSSLYVTGSPRLLARRARNGQASRAFAQRAPAAATCHRARRPQTELGRVRPVGSRRCCTLSTTARRKTSLIEPGGTWEWPTRYVDETFIGAPVSGLWEPFRCFLSGRNFGTYTTRCRKPKARGGAAWHLAVGQRRGFARGNLLIVRIISSERKTC
jgi:hypothetical protein